MAGLNKVMLIGRLGRDPELKYSQSGMAVCQLNIATSESWTDKNSGEKQEKTEWHRVVSFGKQAEILDKYLSKGSQVYIEGKLQTRTYEKDGQTHYVTEIVATGFTFLGGGGDPKPERQQTHQPGAGSAAGGYNNPGNVPPDDDIPF